jgi:hypothetical protein
MVPQDQHDEVASPGIISDDLEFSSATKFLCEHVPQNQEAGAVPAPPER